MRKYETVKAYVTFNKSSSKMLIKVAKNDIEVYA